MAQKAEDVAAEKAEDAVVEKAEDAAAEKAEDDAAEKADAATESSESEFVPEAQASRKEITAVAAEARMEQLCRGALGICGILLSLRGYFNDEQYGSKSCAVYVLRVLYSGQQGFQETSGAENEAAVKLDSSQDNLRLVPFRRQMYNQFCQVRHAFQQIGKQRTMDPVVGRRWCRYSSHGIPYRGRRGASKLC